ncbi:protein ECT2-like [Rhopilema esculentum]|uniref:protein ECT2-like n=1 Tax=Rhopilema esculentum TaxID=499914 RepID=UPI0031D4B655
MAQPLSSARVYNGIDESIASSVTSLYSDSDQPEKKSFCLTNGIFLSDKLLLEAIRGLNGDFKCILPEELDQYSAEKKKHYFICEDFGNEIYTTLHKKRCLIVGAPYIISTYRIQKDLPDLHRPVYNRAMFGVCLCFTGFRSKEEMSRLCRLVHHMGGSIKKEFSGQITHLVACCIYQGSVKYKSALSFGTHIMSASWIEKAWENKNDIDFKATDEIFIEKWKMRPFQGLKLSFLGFPAEEQKHMEETAVENGANFVPIGDPACTHVVVEHSVTELPNETASKSLQVVKQEWFWASIQIDARADETMYLFHGDSNASPYVNSASRKSQKRKLHNVDISELLSPDSPLYSNRKRTKDRLSLLSSTTLDSSLGSMVEISREGDIAEEETPKTAQVPLTARHQISLELQQTEKNYYDTLVTLIKVFKEPLEQSFDQRGGPLLVAEEIKTVFGSLPEIVDVHQRILKDIDSLMENWKEDNLIGKIIVDHADRMSKAYPQFVNYFDMAKETIVRCDEERPRFHAFLKICLTKPECGRQSLTELLIRPVQRLPSMSLLINDLLKKTPTSNPDHDQLTKAAAAIKSVLNFINEDRRKTEGQFQMFEIIREVEGCPAYVLSSQRRLVSKANMSEVSDILSGKGDNLTMFLFTDSIEVTKRKGVKSVKSTNNIPMKSPGPTKTPQRNYKHVEFMPFSHIKSLVDIVDRGEVKNLFALTYVSPLDARQRMLVFKLSGEIEKKDWLDELVKTLIQSNCCPDTENLLQVADPEELKLIKSDSAVDGAGRRGGTLSRAYKKAKNTTKRVGRAISLTKTPKRTQIIRRTFSSATHTGGRSQNVSPTPSEMSMVSMADFDASICDESFRRF